MHLTELVSFFANLRHDPVADFKAHVGNYLGVKHVFVFENARGAMTALIRALATATPERRQVVIPSYTCYSVAASVVKAGLEPLVCDVDPNTLTYSRQQLRTLDLGEILAVVTGNLYGLPNDVSDLESFLRGSGAHLVDDAAQSLGATIGDRNSGTFGSAGLLSLDKGKVVTSINGGVIITNDDSIAHKIKSIQESLRQQNPGKKLIEVAKLLAYTIFLRPSLYWVPSRIPFLNLGETLYDQDFPIRAYFEPFASIADSQLARIGEINSHRVACARIYEQVLPNSSRIHQIRPIPDSSPVYLRFPLLITDALVRRQFLKKSHRLGCAASYPKSIPDIPEMAGRVKVHNQMCEGGRHVAASIVTLPTHSYVRQQDILEICGGLQSTLAETAYRHESQ